MTREGSSRAVHLAFVVHNHQPVGNFDYVMEDAAERAYAPFLDVLERHPDMPFGLHISGPLLDWLSDRQPDYLARVRALARRGQVELVTGGYYEPILPALADADRRGQIHKMSAVLAARFDARPRGLWLAERVWEPGLVTSLAAAGVEYTMVDDTHFHAAGFTTEELTGYYLTEDQGERLAILPIDKRMRYLVPFEAPERTIDYLREVAERAPGSLVLLADDGEKFGVWPGTHALAYGERWLERWIELLLANRDWLELTTCARYLDQAPPAGRAYLPTSSYAEMGEWALGAAGGARLEAARDALASTGAGDDAQRFLRGGFWRHFMVTYPEVNHMHKRVQEVAARLRATAAAPADAQDAIWAAQCNCAYWHGVFGGIYLPHLRDAIYTRLAYAERALTAVTHGDRPFIELTASDIDLDGRDEWRVETQGLIAYVDPDEGGALVELTDRRTGGNLANTLARRREPVHARLEALEFEGPGADHAAAGEAGSADHAAAGEADSADHAAAGEAGSADHAAAGEADSADHAAADAEGGGGARSIHHELRLKEPDLANRLVYDRGRRLIGSERLLAPGAALEAIASGTAHELADLTAVSYAAAPAAADAAAVLVLTGASPLAASARLKLDKRWTFGREGRIALDIGLELEAAAPLRALFLSEWNVAMLAGRADDRYYRLPGVEGDDRQLASTGITDQIDRVALCDAWRDLEFTLSWDRPATLLRYPVETVSLSEAGAERIYQCSAVCPTWEIELEPGRRLAIQLQVELSRVRQPSLSS